MNLIIDIGNTQYKICIFDKYDMIYNTYTDTLSKKFIAEIVDKYKIKKAIYSDTRGVDKNELLKKIPQSISVLELTQNTKLPIDIEYKTIQTLGKDRIAGAVAADGIFKNYPCLIIDIGTAITIDFVTDKGVFKGGAISPGPIMRYKALNNYTGKLPLVDYTEDVMFLGDSTTTSIQSGVQNGILYEINGHISRFKEKYPELKIIITGGYAFLFETKINYRIFANPFVIPDGLNRILIYNENI
jgi:type III pantothenate kinase